MYTTIKVPRELKEKLEEYAKSRSLTLAGAVERLLEESDLKEELREIGKLLKQQNELLRLILEELRKKEFREAVRESGMQEDEVYKEEINAELPSFVKGNPWLRVLRQRK